MGLKCSKKTCPNGDCLNSQSAEETKQFNANFDLKFYKNMKSKKYRDILAIIDFNDVILDNIFAENKFLIKDYIIFLQKTINEMVKLDYVVEEAQKIYDMILQNHSGWSWIATRKYISAKKCDKLPGYIMPLLQTSHNTGHIPIYKSLPNSDNALPSVQKMIILIQKIIIKPRKHGYTGDIFTFSDLATIFLFLVYPIIDVKSPLLFDTGQSYIQKKMLTAMFEVIPSHYFCINSFEIFRSRIHYLFIICNRILISREKKNKRKKKGDDSELVELNEKILVSFPDYNSTDVSSNSLNKIIKNFTSQNNSINMDCKSFDIFLKKYTLYKKKIKKNNKNKKK
jgi:hypothetical protein